MIRFLPTPNYCVFTNVVFEVPVLENYPQWIVPMSEVIEEPCATVEAAGRKGRMLDSIALGVEKKFQLFLGLSIAIFLLITLAHSMRRFWFDELHTYYISRLPTWHDSWQVILSGVDFNPPGVYLMTRWSQAMFGISPTATRLPEILLFLVMCCSIFVFVRRRYGALFALGAMWFPLITVAYSYSSEARPHALVLGFCALAMVSWQRATEGGARGWSLAVLSLSVAGFLLSHCFSVLILIAFGIAELARLASRRKADWILWTSIAAPVSSVLIYLPMLRNVKGMTMRSIIFTPGLSLVPRFYRYLFNDRLNGVEPSFWHETIWPLFIVVILAALLKNTSRNLDDGELVPTGMPAHEVIFLVSLSLLPVFGQSMALLTKSPFNDRYALSAVIGLSILLAAFVFKVTGGDRRAGLAMTMIFGAWFVFDFGDQMRAMFQEHPWDLPSIELSSLPKDTLIVISDPLMFVEAEFYEPPQVAKRLRLLTDAKLAIRYTGTDMFDRGFYKSQDLLQVKGLVQDYQTFLNSTTHFMVFGPFTDPEDWVMRSLLTSGATMNLKQQGSYFTTHGQQCMLLDVTNDSSRQ
jgi:hypothetical protein